MTRIVTLKRLLAWILGVTAVGCTMTSGSGSNGAAVPAPATRPPAAVTVTLAEYPAPTPPGAPTLPPYPPPPPTPPYPGPSPYPSRTLPPPTPTAAVNSVNDCDAHPGFARCGGVPLTGKLAYFPPDNRLTVLDFAAETAWRSSQSGLQNVSWSPEGNLLLTHNRAGRSFLYQSDGVLFDYAEYPLKWSPYSNRLLSGSTIWSPKDAMSASIVYVESETKEASRARPEQIVEIYLPLGESPNPLRWPLSDSAFPDQFFILLDWVPQTDWRLIGQGRGGTATQATAGYRLLALNARTGEILDSGLSLPAGGYFDWHPFETGLLATTDLTNSAIGGMGRLALWRIPENRVTHPPASTPHTLAPAWSPDGRYLAYAAFDLSGQFWLEVLDTQTGTAVKRAEWGAWPAWNRDGSAIFYLEVTSEEETTRVRAVGREEGNPLTVAAARPLRGIGLSHPQTVFDYLP
ncbi:MAG: hypothetical protein HF973_08495 [Chloroflexi bacterium]|nr:hypothetical protein [Chloroflexota bacterium]